MADAWVAMAVAALATAAAVPIAAAVARRLGILDHPGGRKAHGRPTPLLGGAALCVGLVAASVVHAAPAGFVGAAVAAWAVGTLDDVRRGGLGAGTKLVLQCAVVALWTVWSGASAFDGVVVLFAMNGFNLLDNADGVCATVAVPLLVVGAALSGLAIAWAAAGACIAFLAFNRPSARIFLGDGGSHLVGFVCGVVALASARGVTGVLGASGALALTALLIVPIVDTAVVVATRLRRGSPIWVGDRNHLSHRLHRAGLSEFQALGCLFLGGSVGGAVAAALLVA